jgi:hypothetical protein
MRRAIVLLAAISLSSQCRVEAWDGGFGIHHAEHILLEDVAAFGSTHEPFSASKGGNFVRLGLLGGLLGAVRAARRKEWDR